MFKSDSLV